MDIEATLIEWLSKNTDIEWHGNIPKRKPPFGTVERTGGGMSDVVIDSPMVAIQVWGESRSQAKKIAYEVKRILPRIVYEPRFKKATIQSLYNFPDDKGNKARYQIVAEFKTV